MKKNYVLLSIAVLVMMAGSCQREIASTTLFNGENLDNWDKYLGSSIGGDYDSLSKAAKQDEVFSIAQVDGENVIRISGIVNGSLATKQSYKNYHLRMVFKWGDTVYTRRNSGLLYHSFGDFGVAFGTWKPNIELQLMHQNLGDTYLMANTSCQTEVLKDTLSQEYIYSAGKEKMIFGEHANGRLIRKSHDMEKPLGEWNTVDLYCFGTTAIHVINGETVMVNTNTGTYDNDKITELSSGVIQIQSEGAELFVRSIDLRPITALPDGLIK